MPTPASVLDASAILAYIRDEPGASAVEEALTAGAVANIVNWAEVLTVVVRTGGTVLELEERLASAGILGTDGLLTIVGITPEDARVAAALYPVTSTIGLSLGDRLCLATGLRLHLPLLTAERSWIQLSIPGARVRLIRSNPE